MKVLFLSRWYPYPPDNGSKLRILSLLNGLCEQHQVTLISFIDPGEKAADAFPRPSPERIHICPYRGFIPSSRRALLGYFSRTPRYLVDTHRPEMESLISRTISQAPFDLVVASQVSMACYYRSFLGIRAIFEEAELGIFKPLNPRVALDWGVRRQTLTWVKYQKFISRLLKHFRLCTVASEIERELVASAAPDYQAVHVIPNSIDVEGYRGTSSNRLPGSLVFIGSLRFAPNRDAITWFLNEIYPAIRKGMHLARLTITGDLGSPPPLLGDSSVTLTGRLEDIHSIVSMSAVSLAPIRSGGGTRLKILESMALRTPVVATTKAAEGLDARSGEHLLIADRPSDFAEAVITLLRQPRLARQIADNAFKLVQTQYNSRVVVPRFMSLVEQAVSP